MQYQQWRENLKSDKKVRNYQHIDNSLNIDSEITFRKVVSIISNIKDHQFLPFIKRPETTIRFRKNSEGIPTRKLKVRPIMYASHIDSHIYSYYNFIYYKRCEAELKRLSLDENIIAYRKIDIPETGKGKSNVHYAKEVFSYISKQEESVVITQDIEGFFDNINHNLLKEKICEVISEDRLDDSFYKVFRSLTAYKYINHSDFIDKKVLRKIKSNKYAIYKILKGLVKENKTSKGIPQGSPISGLLANIYLIDFDRCLKDRFPDIFYRRYSDDLLFVCKPSQKDELLKFIAHEVNKVLLKINAKKSFISYFKKSGVSIICERVTDGLHNPKGRNYVDYLGFEFTGDSTFLRKNTLRKLKSKQINKAKSQFLNTKSPDSWMKPWRKGQKKTHSKRKKNRNNYFKNTLRIINDTGLKRQLLKVVKDRNIVKRGNKVSK